MSVDCDHPSATGVDTTPLGDPRKIWRCDTCGFRYRCVESEGITTRVPADEPRCFDPSCLCGPVKP